MSKFLVQFLAPPEGMDEWMKTDEETRKKEEKKMKDEWDAWMSTHKDIFAGKTAGVGKPKRVTKEGVEDARNNIMLYSIVEADSHEAAAEMFKDHPHFGIPDSSIEIMQINYLPGMEDMQ